MSKVVLLNKPFGYLSQFSDSDGHPGLRSLCPVKGVYAAGRLDRDSEGLLVLTDDGQLQARICEPKTKFPKTYLVLVEGEPDQQALDTLRQGVKLKDGITAPAEVELIEPPALWPRNPPVRVRKHIRDSWLRLTLTEGRNRQVRRMTAAVGYPTLRLVRESIGPWSIQDIASGEYREETVHLPRTSRRTSNDSSVKKSRIQRKR